jgi:hypothetical protein
MLEFAGGIGLGVDVGDLLELERPLHRDRVLLATPEKERVLFVDEALGECRNGLVETQHVLDLAGRARSSATSLASVAASSR